HRVRRVDRVHRVASAVRKSGGGGGGGDPRTEDVGRGGGGGRGGRRGGGLGGGGGTGGGPPPLWLLRAVGSKRPRGEGAGRGPRGDGGGRGPQARLEAERNRWGRRRCWVGQWSASSTTSFRRRAARRRRRKRPRDRDEACSPRSRGRCVSRGAGR